MSEPLALSVTSWIIIYVYWFVWAFFVGRGWRRAQWLTWLAFAGWAFGAQPLLEGTSVLSLYGAIPASFASFGPSDFAILVGLTLTFVADAYTGYILGRRLQLAEAWKRVYPQEPRTA